MITTEKLLAQYRNGNYVVALYADGTKTRTWPGIDPAAPEFPESIDLKITDRCDMGCPFCHESSTPEGHHADPDYIRYLVGGLPRGVEVAIGGGNPLAHPQLLRVLTGMFRDGLVANMTVNITHAVKQYPLFSAARQFCHGIGLSDRDGAWSLINQLRPGLVDRDTVVHAIAGVDWPNKYLRVPKLLVLGYKRAGRGEAHWNPEVDRKIECWRYWLRRRLSTDSYVTSFDNLALEQLRVRELIGEDRWAECYMGDDGQFTMYVDAVAGTFAVSSTAERRPLDGRTIAQAFKLLRSAP